MASRTGESFARISTTEANAAATARWSVAGPSVLALLGGPEKLDYRHHLDSLGSIVRETGIAWHISSLDVERQGARVLLPEPLSG